MMKLDIFTMKGKKTDKQADLSDKIFNAAVNIDLMHQAYVRQMANARLGTHKTKTRSEVRGGGRKPWKQKGTGRARQGTIRAPQFVGGGGVFTPRPRDYSKRMPRKMRQAALRSALSVKAADKEIIIVDDLNIDGSKTSVMSKMLLKLTGNDSALILIPDKDEKYDAVVRSSTNLPTAKTLNANYLNIRDILGYDKLIIPVNALDVIASYLE
ncbi:MAG: 50S ribosomal protein L4 [Chloroflexota bacterium]